MDWFRSIRRRDSRWHTLSIQEKWIVAYAAVLLLLGTALFRSLGLKRGLAALRLLPGRFNPEYRLEPHQLQDLVELVGRNLPVAITCLPRSAALYWLLERVGHEAELRIGVRKDGEVLRAHAWVECAGEVLEVHEPALLPWRSFAVPIQSVILASE